MKNNALIIFVKNLIPGQVKTRLAATLGNIEAMEIYELLLKNLHNKVHLLAFDKIVFYADFIGEDIWEADQFKKEIQHGNDLGERMKNAFKVSFEKGYKKLIIIGSDCPEMSGAILENAFKKLDDFDIVLGPATDGGYYLVAMKKPYPNLFQDIEWSTDQVLRRTIAHCIKNKLTYFLLPELSDVDTEEDLKHFEYRDLLKQKYS